MEGHGDKDEAWLSTDGAKCYSSLDFERALCFCKEKTGLKIMHHNIGTSGKNKSPLDGTFAAVCQRLKCNIMLTKVNVTNNRAIAENLAFDPQKNTTVSFLTASTYSPFGLMPKGVANADDACMVIKNTSRMSSRVFVYDEQDKVKHIVVHEQSFLGDGKKITINELIGKSGGEGDLVMAKDFPDAKKNAITQQRVAEAGLSTTKRERDVKSDIMRHRLQARAYESEEKKEKIQEDFKKRKERYHGMQLYRCSDVDPREGGDPNCSCVYQNEKCFHKHLKGESGPHVYGNPYSAGNHTRTMELIDGELVQRSANLETVQEYAIKKLHAVITSRYNEMREQQDISPQNSYKKEHLSYEITLIDGTQHTVMPRPRGWARQATLDDGTKNISTKQMEFLLDCFVVGHNNPKHKITADIAVDIMELIGTKCEFMTRFEVFGENFAPSIDGKARFNRTSLLPLARVKGYFSRKLEGLQAQLENMKESTKKREEAEKRVPGLIEQLGAEPWHAPTVLKLKVDQMKDLVQYKTGSRPTKGNKVDFFNLVKRHWNCNAQVAPSVAARIIPTATSPIAMDGIEASDSPPSVPAACTIPTPDTSPLASPLKRKYVEEATIEQPLEQPESAVKKMRVL